jgi:hypothetical protein
MIDEKGNRVFGEPTEYMKKSTAQRHIDYLEEEIRDVQLMLRGSSDSKHWQDWKLKLKILQDERRDRFWELHRDELGDKVKVSSDGTHVIDYQGAVPDL